LGIAGAGRLPAGTGGGARELERGGGCVTPRLGPPGDGGDNLEFMVRLIISLCFTLLQICY